MPRKTRYEIQAEETTPIKGSERYWKIKKMEASAAQAAMMAKHKQLIIAKMEGDLIPVAEVRDMFGRVFAAYRQAIKEIDRRYGPDAAQILIAAERAALRRASSEKPLE